MTYSAALDLLCPSWRGSGLSLGGSRQSLGGYHSLLGIRICFEKTLIFTKDKDILSQILRIRDKTLHANNERIKYN